MKIGFNVFAAVLALLVPLTVSANAGFTPGNVLVSYDNTVFEHTPDGELVSQLSIPTNSSGEVSRDLVVLDDGRLAVFNGTFAPTLSIWNGSTWEHLTLAGWSTVNNVSYGGIAAFGNTVLVTDMFTYGGESMGIIAFDLSSGTARHVYDANEYIDLAIGKDGLLYALRNAYGDLDVIDPATFTLLRTVDLGHTSGSRSVDVNANGEIFMSSWSGYIGHYTAAGELLNTLTIGGSLFDIDLDGAGRVITGSRFDNAYITDESFSSLNSIYNGRWNIFVANVPDVQDVPAAPVLTPSKDQQGAWITTTLNWTTDAPGVDVYYNGELVDTFTDVTTASYRNRKQFSQIYTVCNVGTQDCSEFVAN